MTNKQKEAQQRGRRSRLLGKKFEERLADSFEFYKLTGAADIDKRPEAMRVLKRLDGGKFIACFMSSEQADYEGVLRGGRAVAFEAKYTEKDRIEQAAVENNERRYLNRKEAMGAKCYVVVGFASQEVYCIPWSVWERMKDRWGRKYAKEEELKLYRVPSSRTGVLLLIN